MAVTNIPWGDGSGDYIHLTYTAASGNQTIAVTSDAHDGYVERSKDITFTASGTASAVLTVKQAGKDIVIITRNDVAMTDNNVAVGYEQ